MIKIKRFIANKRNNIKMQKMSNSAHLKSRLFYSTLDTKL